jgi:hypothetical protein
MVRHVGKPSANRAECQTVNSFVVRFEQPEALH